MDLGLVQRGAFADGDEDVRGRTARPGRRRIVERGMPRGRRKAGIEDVDAIWSNWCWVLLDLRNWGAGL